MLPVSVEKDVLRTNALLHKKWDSVLHSVDVITAIRSKTNKLFQLFIFPDKCTGLPDSFSFGLRTTTFLPVDYGTEVELECISGYSSSGSRLITCIKDKNWEYEETPDCSLGLYSGDS